MLSAWLYYLFLYDLQNLFLHFPCAGFSHQQVAVCQRHPALQTDGGEVRIWQPVAPLTPGIKNLFRGEKGEGGREAEDIC